MENRKLENTTPAEETEPVFIGDTPGGIAVYSFFWPEELDEEITTVSVWEDEEGKRMVASNRELDDGSPCSDRVLIFLSDFFSLKSEIAGVESVDIE